MTFVDVLNPATERVVRRVPLATVAQAEAAIGRAVAAAWWPRTWWASR